MKILVTGVMGSGKSTLALKISAEFSMPYVSADMFRHNAENPTKLLPMTDGRAALKEFVTQHSDWVIDGFQLWAFRDLHGKDRPDIIVNLNIPTDQIIKNYHARAKVARRVHREWSKTGVMDTNVAVLPLHFRGGADKDLAKFLKTNEKLAARISEFMKTVDPRTKVFDFYSRRQYRAVFNYIRKQILQR